MEQALPQNAPTSAEAQTQAPKPTTDVLVAHVPDYPKDLYDAAHIENGHIDFNNRILAVRGPNQGKPPYVPPPIPEAVSKQTELEMAAGAHRVKHFEALRAEQKEIAARTKEPWEGKSTAIFRPAEAREYTNIKAPAVSKDRGLVQPQLKG